MGHFQGMIQVLLKLFPSRARGANAGPAGPVAEKKWLNSRVVGPPFTIAFSW